MDNATKTLFLTSYKYWRRNGLSPSEAMANARDDLANGRCRPRYYDRSSVMGAPNENGNRWCEDPSAVGLRFVGFADEIAGRAVDHLGWYTDADGDNGCNLRGAVYQLPARRGRPVYIYGYREGYYRFRDRSWSDTSGDETVLLNFRDLVYGDHGEDDRAKYDAAIWADDMARLDAEDMCEHNEAFRKGEQFAELGREVSNLRGFALQLIREIKSHGKNFTSAICRALREKLESTIEDYNDAKLRRAELLDEWTGYRPGDWRYSLEQSFRSGAGLPVAG